MQNNKLNTIFNITDPSLSKYDTLNDVKPKFYMRMNTGLVSLFLSNELSENIYIINDISKEKIKLEKCEHKFNVITKQIRGADESFTCIYTCEKCGFVYTAN
jgi:DNA-directed RNA polymerase subunit M/transcription elongation factor TFIIS